MNGSRDPAGSKTDTRTEMPPYAICDIHIDEALLPGSLCGRDTG
jgi:hypothetical protein